MLFDYTSNNNSRLVHKYDVLNCNTTFFKDCNRRFVQESMQLRTQRVYRRHKMTNDDARWEIATSGGKMKTSSLSSLSLLSSVHHSRCSFKLTITPAKRWARLGSHGPRSAAVWRGFTTRVFNRPKFSGRRDFQAEKFGRQCTKSRSLGLQENSSKNLIQNKALLHCASKKTFWTFSIVTWRRIIGF